MTPLKANVLLDAATLLVGWTGSYVPGFVMCAMTALIGLLSLVAGPGRGAAPPLPRR